MPILAERGYLIPAIDTDSVDYLSCAIQLARSIRQWHPDANISVLSVKRCSDPVFDHVIPLPHGDLGGYANDCQVFYASPYRQTIKLEADMFIPNDISWWFDVLKERDLVIATTIRDHANKISKNRFYRKFIDANVLPDTYNAITYFKKSDIAKQFYAIVADVFVNWNTYKEIYTLSSEASTDEAYAIAASIIGIEHAIMPTFTEMSMIHMKNFILNTELEDWTNELMYEFTEDNFKIDTIPQLYPVHYHIKSFAHVLNQELLNE